MATYAIETIRELIPNWDRLSRPARIAALDDVADSDVEQLTTSTACLELGGDQSAVAWVVTHLEHRDNIIFPAEQISSGWHGLKSLLVVVGIHARFSGGSPFFSR